MDKAQVLYMAISTAFLRESLVGVRVVQNCQALKHHDLYEVVRTNEHSFVQKQPVCLEIGRTLQHVAFNYSPIIRET